MPYRLTATLGDLTQSEEFEADTYPVELSDDFKATTHAGLRVVTLARPDRKFSDPEYQNLWANGRIELRDPYGKVIHVMEEKATDDD